MPHTLSCRAHLHDSRAGGAGSTQQLEEALYLALRLLDPDPFTRLSAADALHLPFFDAIRAQQTAQEAGLQQLQLGVAAATAEFVREHDPFTAALLYGAGGGAQVQVGRGAKAPVEVLRAIDTSADSKHGRTSAPSQARAAAAPPHQPAVPRTPPTVRGQGRKRPSSTPPARSSAQRRRRGSDGESSATCPGLGGLARRRGSAAASVLSAVSIVGWRRSRRLQTEAGDTSPR
jgi:hypothetical protein